jgi:hypothetical protein
MSRTKTLATVLAALCCSVAALAPAASAAPGPAWQLTLRSHPTNLAPGSTVTQAPKYPQYTLNAYNVGGAPSAGAITLSVQLPPSGIGPAAALAPVLSDQDNTVGTGSCSVIGRTVTCTDPNTIDPGEWVEVVVPVDVEELPDPSVLDATATIAGGGASAATVQIQTTVSGTIAPVGLLPGFEGFNSSVVKEEGAPATDAGSHPQQMNVNLGLPTQLRQSNTPIPDGTLDDVRVDLPAGLVVDPAATPKCSTAQFTALICPDATQVGIATVPLSLVADPVPQSSGLYNLEPPPGYAAALGFEVVNVPVVILGGVRPGDYRITSLTADSIAPLAVFSARIQLWGSPSDVSHDKARGVCSEPESSATCPVPRTEKPLLSMPTSCGDSMRIDAHISLWEEPGKLYDRDTELADANGNPTEVTGCNQLQFAPSLKARPTTNLADSPTGLSVELRIPQTESVKEKATAHLKKAVVALPEGLALNPSSANGLDSCDPSEIGIDASTGVANGNQVTCPAASRIGTVEVDTPLLEHPLPGSVFVATPHENPFDSLLAIYVVVDDQPTQTLIKLAGHVVADPKTGRLITTFEDNPQLPFDAFKLDFFSGAYAPLRTPATCGIYATTSQMTPWSAPDSGPPATPKDTWAISQAPSGGCATSRGALPNSPSFEAGSAGVLAGAHSPFVLHLRRNDATQSFSAVTISPPPGLVAKLAGTESCSDAALASAAQKSGKEEKVSPSCPSSSQVGSFTAGAGAGPAPYYASGKVYLSGPYKGAPLSFAFITPAVAGPYDLGTIVTKAAVYVDRESARVTTVSDPLPEILQGIPLDVRSVDVSLDKPDFTRNGTSCDPLSVDGTLVSTLGNSVSLQSGFQLGECSSLAFKPRLSLRLKGGTRRTAHPKLIAVLRSSGEEANLSRVQVKLPPSAFLDQAHIKTICTRVQFAADTCPQGSIYGKASVKTPLFAEPLTGNVYLRSSSHNLPDLVLDLRGPASQPIHIEVAGTTDSVKGALRNTFEAVPDAPFETARVELFGGKRGLVVNSRNLCAHPYRATVELEGQNGKAYEAKPLVKTDCKKQRKRKAPRNVAGR